MMQEKAVRWLGAASFCVVFVAFASCAGSETPRISDDFEDAIANTFGDGSVGAAGSSGGGRGGRGGSANAGSAGSSGSSMAGNGGGASGECDGFDILKRSCDGENCHGAGAQNGNFAENEEIAAAFAGEDPVTAGCSEEGPVINVDNPRGSLLIQKVNGTVPCGGAMPLVGQLSEEQIDCLEEWIGDL
jgi:hypothetical protein